MQRSHHARTALAALALGMLITVGACNQEQKTQIDSAAASVEANVRSALSVIDIDAGRHLDANNEVTNSTDQFAPTDTIFASVHTSGTASSGTVVGRWTFEDGSVAKESSQSVTTSGDSYAAFFLADPMGLKKGKYTLHVMIGGEEVRSKDVTVS